MEMSKGANDLLPEIHIQSVQTVTPTKVTDPRQVRQVSAVDPIGFGIFRKCLHILLYHAKATEDGARWFHVGWLRESLARALLEQPLIAGRFRQAFDRQNEEGNQLEIVSNDSGVRLFQTSIPITLSEFLDLKGSRDGEDAEAKLVFWKDIDEQNPQYSPLVYVQENFLKKWAKIHNNLLSKDDLPTAPMYYIPDIMKSTGCSPTSIFSSNPSNKCGQTVIFTISAETVNPLKDDALQLCVEEAEKKYGNNMAPNFPMFLKTNYRNAIKVEKFPKDGLIKPKRLGSRSQLSRAVWDDFGANEIEFRKGNKPEYVSYWVGFVSGGLVMAMPSADRRGSLNEVKVVIVTVPIEKEV
ncbi:hypothetical protein DVH24_001114 [Malus domestica]|uniref:Uncharacterized protein n=1 Tax=Malus domestica TaxID=3750 RepID=A0A498JYB8_MALDO|nr:hypothetical protein DVH24_001114 [Malus domestica]